MGSSGLENDEELKREKEYRESVLNSSPPAVKLDRGNFKVDPESISTWIMNEELAGKVGYYMNVMQCLYSLSLICLNRYENICHHYYVKPSSGGRCTAWMQMVSVCTPCTDFVRMSLALFFWPSGIARIACLALLQVKASKYKRDFTETGPGKLVFLTQEKGINA
jgi:hypothetical protein